MHAGAGVWWVGGPQTGVLVMPLAAQHLGPTCCPKCVHVSLSRSHTLSLFGGDRIAHVLLDPWFCLWCSRQVWWLLVLLWWAPALHPLQYQPACLLRGNTSGSPFLCVLCLTTCRPAAWSLLQKGAQKKPGEGDRYPPRLLPFSL